LYQEVERGLLIVAFHPAFVFNRTVLLNYTRRLVESDDVGGTVIARAPSRSGS